MADETTASADEQLRLLRKECADLIVERHRLQHGLRRMFGLATYYIGAHIHDLKEHRANDPELQARLEGTMVDGERCKLIMTINGLTD